MGKKVQSIEGKAIARIGQFSIFSMLCKHYTHSTPFFKDHCFNIVSMGNWSNGKSYDKKVKLQQSMHR